MNTLQNKRQRLENNDNYYSTSAPAMRQPLSSSFGIGTNGHSTISFLNGGNALNELKWKMQALEAKVGRLEAEKKCCANLETRMREMREEFTMRLATMEQKHQEEMAKLKAEIEKNRTISETPKITKEKDTVKVKSEPTIQAEQQENIDQPILQSRHPQLQILDKSKRSIGNPEGNKWNAATTLAITYPDGLNVINNTTGWRNIYANKGFPTFMVGNSHNTTIYYYEVKCNNASIAIMKFRIGLSDRYLNDKFLVGNHPNTYALPHARNNKLFISGQKQQFKLPAPERATIPQTPKRNGPGDVYGFGLVLSPENTLAIFVTLNGTLMCNQIPISCSVDCLYPSVSMSSMSIEANFGSDPAKPFLYDIQKCPGMVFK